MKYYSQNKIYNFFTLTLIFLIETNSFVNFFVLICVCGYWVFKLLLYLVFLFNMCTYVSLSGIFLSCVHIFLLFCFYLWWLCIGYDDGLQNVPYFDVSPLWLAQFRYPSFPVFSSLIYMLNNHNIGHDVIASVSSLSS